MQLQDILNILLPLNLVSGPQITETVKKICSARPKSERVSTLTLQDTNKCTNRQREGQAVVPPPAPGPFRFPLTVTLRFHHPHLNAWAYWLSFVTFLHFLWNRLCPVIHLEVPAMLTGKPCVHVVQSSGLTFWLCVNNPSPACTRVTQNLQDDVCYVNSERRRADSLLSWPVAEGCCSLNNILLSSHRYRQDWWLD